MSFVCRNQYVYYKQVYLFRFDDNRTANVFCDLCNLFLKYNPIRKFGDEDE